MTCYLHIGVPKTGTTSTQSFLYANYELLKRQKFLYPKSMRIIQEQDYAHHYFAECLSQYFTGNKNLLDYCLKQLQAEIDAAKMENVILSNEAIPGICDTYEKTQYLQKILCQLGFKNIIVVVYLRDVADIYVSALSQRLKGFTNPSSSLKQEELVAAFAPAQKDISPKTIFYSYKKTFNYKAILQYFIAVFGKDKMIVRLFDKAEFVQGDLIRDFLDAVGLHWDSAFVLPKNQNESLDLLGMEIAKALYKHDFPEIRDDIIASKIYEYTTKSLTSKDPNLKFMPPKELYESYLNFYAESNEWVRTEFFPQRQSLFPPKDLSTYKENYELREMKPEYWDRIAQFVADILIDSINAHNTLSTRKPTNFIQADSALAHVQNELPYKLGEALAQNTKSFWGFICLPFVLSYIKNGHNAKQRIYEQELAQGNAPAIPPLSSYPDYEEALKLQRSFLYSLGKALIVYNNKGEAKLSYLSFIRKVLSSIKRNKGVRKQLTHLSSEQ